jgi:hypothetical protein
MSTIIQEALDNKPFILQLVENLKAGKAGGTSNNVFDGTAYQYTDSNIPAKEFLKCLFYIWQRHPGHWNWSNLYQHWNLRTHKKSTSLDVLSQLPKEHYDLLPSYVLTKVKKHKSTYTLDTKNLAFDEFALATFTMWLESKKKLTSTECLSMLKQINRIHMDQIYIATIKLQYVNLLWQYTPTKSIELTKYYCEHFSYPEFYTRLPIAAISRHSDLTNIDGTDIQAISFSINWYQGMADIHRIPVSQAIMTTQWSTVYRWVSNIPKSTPLNAQGIAEAIDQIIILTAAANILPNLKQPIDALRQHITAELCSSKYTNIKELLYARLANLSSIDTMLKDLHDRL